MVDLLAAGGENYTADRVLYNLTGGDPEHDLLLWLAGRDVPAMAYSSVEQGRLIIDKMLRGIAVAIGTVPAQVALAWTMRRSGVIAISPRRAPPRMSARIAQPPIWRCRTPTWPRAKPLPRIHAAVAGLRGSEQA